MKDIVYSENISYTKIKVFFMVDTTQTTNTLYDLKISFKSE